METNVCFNLQFRNCKGYVKFPNNRYKVHVYVKVGIGK